LNIYKSFNKSFGVSLTQLHAARPVEPHAHREIFAAQFTPPLHPHLPAPPKPLRIMAPINLSHRRTHNLLLISKLLNLRDTASPFTLLLDSLEQPATPLFKEYIRRAKVCHSASPMIQYHCLNQYYY